MTTGSRAGTEPITHQPVLRSLARLLVPTGACDGVLPAALLRVCTTVDIAVRFGGDEFVLLLPGTNEESAAAFATGHDLRMTLPAPITLSCPAGSGAVYEHGAHLTSWAPAGGEPVIWMSTLARFEPDTAIRGGLPIIFPWFGASRAVDLSPAHGFARTRPWHLVELTSEADIAVAMFELHGSGEPNFPHSFRARYEVRIGSTLQLSLVVENEYWEPFSFEEALHTYLVVGDVREVVVQGLDGCSYLDQVAPGGARVEIQSGDLKFTEETDRIYALRAVRAPPRVALLLVHTTPYSGMFGPARS